MASDRLSWSAPTHLRACQCVPVWPSCFVRAVPFKPPRRRLRGTGVQPAARRLEAEVAGDLELPPCSGTSSSCGRNAPARFRIHSKRKSEAGVSHLTRLLQRNERDALVRRDQIAHIYGRVACGAAAGPAWRTPTSTVVQTPEDFVARVAELGLEGAVAKRLDLRYLPGRRSTRWIKHKARREEQPAITGVRRSPRAEPRRCSWLECCPMARSGGAGAIELGLRRETVDELEQRLAELHPRRRGRVAWYPAKVSVLASVHGLARWCRSSRRWMVLPDGPVSDAALRRMVS